MQSRYILNVQYVEFLVELQPLALKKLKQSRLEVEKHHSLIHFEGQ